MFRLILGLIMVVVSAGAVMAQEAESETSNPAPAVSDAAPVAKKKGTDLRVYWKDGLRLDAADKAVQVKLGGRLMVDYGLYNDGTLSGTADNVVHGAELRRARLYLSGTLYKRVFFKTQYDFASAASVKDSAGDKSKVPGAVGIKDAYIGVKKIPGIGSLSIGNQYEPAGFNELTSSKYITFMERSLATAFTPGRHMGLVAKNDHFDSRLNWAAGVFMPSNSVGSYKGAGKFAASARVGGRVLQNDDAMVHLGASARFNKVNGDVKMETRPEVHIADKLVSGTLKDVDTQWTVGPEFAASFGALHVSGEYIATMLETNAGTTASFFGAYGQVGYFLTGESRSFKGSAGTWSRTKPAKNAFVDGGYGAWEIAARMSHIDLDDTAAAVAGGRMNTYTAALNWYLNPNARIMMNYVRAKVYTADEANLYQARVQIDF